MQPHDFLIFALGLVLGWCLNHFRPYTEKRRTPRKRSKAIPSGTEATRKAGRPRKAPKMPAATGEPLPIDENAAPDRP